LARIIRSRAAVIGACGTVPEADHLARPMRRSPIPVRFRIEVRPLRNEAGVDTVLVPSSPRGNPPLPLAFHHRQDRRRLSCNLHARGMSGHMLKQVNNACAGQGRSAPDGWRRERGVPYDITSYNPALEAVSPLKRQPCLGLPGVFPGAEIQTCLEPPDKQIEVEVSEIRGVGAASAGRPRRPLGDSVQPACRPVPDPSKPKPVAT
jgi:hypothetical protein